MEAETAENWFAEDYATLGDRIAAAREVRGMSVADLARRLGARTETVKRWEADAVEPRGNRMQMLAGVLGVSLTWLMVGQGDGIAPLGAAQVADRKALARAELSRLRGDMAGLNRRIDRLEQLLAESVG